MAWYTQVFTAYVLEHLRARYNMMDCTPWKQNVCYQLAKELISWYQADLSAVVCSAWTFCSWMTQEFQDSESELYTLSLEFEESITSCFVPCKHCKKPKRKFCHCPFNNNKTSLIILLLSDLVPSIAHEWAMVKISQIYFILAWLLIPSWLF